jgi:hypothetical protein
MTFFITSNTILGVAKLHIFRRKKFNTLGDALTLRRLGEWIRNGWRWALSNIAKH